MAPFIGAAKHVKITVFLRDEVTNITAAWAQKEVEETERQHLGWTVLNRGKALRALAHTLHGKGRECTVAAIEKLLKDEIGNRWASKDSEMSGRTPLSMSMGAWAVTTLVKLKSPT